LIKDLGDLPEQKTHCSMLGIDALKKAIKNFVISNQ
ncbi:iron-sulfur cluster assembly scaffold protein, partial [Patescibacteria group bacterium]|nr:iron-sulfur cluster assembly scaffold protein [Patescibacteria group bacterium]